MKVSKPFRVISPRAASAQALRPTTTFISASAESTLTALEESSERHRDSSYRADSPTNIRASIIKTISNDSGPARDESKSRAESVRNFRVRK